MSAHPLGLPVVDVDPFSEQNLENPYPMHEALREAGPLVLIPRYDIYAAARHAEVHQVLNDWQTYISGAGVGLANFNHETPFRPKSLLLEADPPAHTTPRGVLSRILSPKTVQQLRVTFQAEAEALVDRLLAQREIDAVKELAEVYPVQVFPDALGLEPMGRENLLKYGNMVFNAFGPHNEVFQRSATEAAAVTRWVMEHCERAALKPGGFGDQIYQAADAGEITHEQAPMLVRSFLSAGVDTTVNGLGNALMCLTQFPEQYARLHANPALARQAFEESLRLESSVQTFFRTTSRSTELAGVPIAADRKVLTFLGAANRDPRKWARPEAFDIDRKPIGHMAFGSGIHGCVGQVVARLEGELVLAALARRVQRIELAGTPQRRLNNTLRACSSLPVRLIAA
jgi:cytochrome P450